MIAREIGDRRGEGNALGNLGIAYADLGEPRRAIDLYEQQLVIVREIGDRRGEGNALGYLGMAYYSLGETRRAIDLYEQQLVIVRAIGYHGGEGMALGNMAESLTALGRHQDAAKAFAESIALAQADSYRYGEGVRRTNYAALLVLTGDIIQAQHEAAAAAGIAVETDNAQIGSESNTLLALISLLTSDLTRAGAALAAAGRYSYPPTAAEQQFLAGVLALRSDNLIAASNAFAGAIGAADTRLAAEQDLYVNLDGRALARCGLALSQPQGQAGSALVQAAADLRAARAINSDPGRLAQLRLRFGLLAPHDPTQQLAAVTAILDEAEAQER